MQSFDIASQEFFLRHSSAGLFRVMFFYTHLADPGVLICFEIIILLILLFVHREFIGALLTVGVLVGESISLILKNLVARARPDLFITTATREGSSFPSSHALVSVVFYGFLAYLLIRVSHKKIYKVLIALAAIVLIICIGISRVALGVHWASDVIGGWVLGTMVLIGLIISTDVLTRWWNHISHPARIVVVNICVVCVIILAFLTAYYLDTSSNTIRSILYS